MSDRWNYWCGCLVCLALLVSLAAGQEEQWLQYRSAPEVSLPGISVNWQFPEVRSEAPADVPLPSFARDQQYYAKWPTPMVPAGHLWIALDRTGEAGLYDRLYIDANGNGRLDDETAVVPRRMSQYMAYFGPVKVVFQVEDGPVTYHLNIQFYSSNNRQRLYVSAGGWYEGDIKVDGAETHCVLWDHNTNGAFDDKSLDATGCDRIQIGEGRDSAVRFVGRYLDVNGTLYCPEIARDGAYIKLARAEEVSYGRVRLAAAITEFAAGGENGLFVLAPKDGVCSLPTGKYRTNRWTIERPADDGRKWKLQGGGNSMGRSFEVAADQEIELEIGEPIVATLDSHRGKDSYSFNHELKGKDGERIELTCNGARARAPKLHIVNKEGTYDRTYSFSYG